ncbi:MAG: DNA polymerase III subunit alpha, partial [Bdellovibrionales bacterium]|nr:DNA polymerase III subunit alpha [Bdellovibrionales bacterium]
RNPGVHAAGVIITEKPVVEYCARYMGADGAPVTQFDKDYAEKIGLVKFDFLGLKTLTVIDNAVKLIRMGGGADASFTIERIRYDDPKVYELLGSGDTDGVFQVESSGMKDLCTRLKPSSIEDVTAINALYRPGPLGSGMVDDFIDRKHGRQAIVYELPQLESILKDTYGVILYQEQVMQIARELAGFTLGQADMLRRAMGKKKPEEMAKYKEIFQSGAVERQIPADKAATIFDLMAKFAEYGFNKSHSAAYAVLTYQTAYLKAYFPAEFMAALMTTEMSNTDKITKYVGDARSHGIPVLSPDVNASQRRFSVERAVRAGESVKAVRFGLEAIKGVGGSAVDAILEIRDGTANTPPDGRAELPPSGPFKNVLDFVRRVSVRKANKKVMESLTAAGAFDAIAEVNRASLFESLEGLLSHAADEQEERSLGQSSLFDSFSASEVKLVQPAAAVFKEVADWSQSQKLLREKAIVGFYVSGHPMDTWQRICDDWLGFNTQRLRDWAERQTGQPQAAGSAGAGGYQRPKRKEAQVAGIFGELKEITTKKGSRMGFAQLEDLHGKVEVVFFPEAFEACQEKLKRSVAEAEPVVVTGEMDQREGEAKILARSVEWLEELQKGRAKQVFLRLRPSAIKPEQLRELKQSFLAHRGKCPVQIEFLDGHYRTLLKLPVGVQVSGTPQMVAAVNRIFGEPVVDLR